MLPAGHADGFAEQCHLLYGHSQTGLTSARLYL